MSLVFPKPPLEHTPCHLVPHSLSFSRWLLHLKDIFHINEASILGHSHTGKTTRKENKGKGKSLLNFLKSCKHFLHISIFSRMRSTGVSSRSCYDRLKLGAIKIIYYFA